jgi:hypothetical protein
MISIHEVIGERTVNGMDQLARDLGAPLESMPAFAAGRNATADVFIDRTIPDDPLEAAQIVQQEAATTQFSSHADSPEFKLASTIAAYGIARSRE